MEHKIAARGLTMRGLTAGDTINFCVEEEPIHIVFIYLPGLEVPVSLRFNSYEDARRWFDQITKSPEYSDYSVSLVPDYYDKDPDHVMIL